MEMKHVLNERLKRLEPTDTRCYYCELENSQSMNDNVFIPLFKEQDRTNVVVYRSVKYQKIEVGIPRCPACKTIHEEAAKKSKLYAWGAVIVMVVFCFLIWGIWGIFAIFAGIFIGFGGSYFLENKMVRDKQIFTKKDGAERNDTVQEFIIRGWGFNQPSA